METEAEELEPGRPDFELAFFSHDASCVMEAGYVRFERAVAAELMLTTGRIVACDGLIPSLQPFIQEVKPATYPVVLCLAHYEHGGYNVCDAMLQFIDQKPVRWELARFRGEIEADRGGHYWVDCGVGCFADLSAMLLLTDAPAVWECLQDRVNGRDRGMSKDDASVFCLDEATGLNIVVFKSGEGDGVYPSYFGYDRYGEVVCLATDFGIIPPLPYQERYGKEQLTLGL